MSVTTMIPNLPVNTNDVNSAADISKTILNGTRVMREAQRLFSGEECSDSKLIEHAKESTTKAQKELNAYTEKVLAEQVTSLVEAITTAAAAAGNSSVEAAETWAKTLASEVLNGYLITPLMSVVATVLTALPGMQTYIAYLAIKQLAEHLYKRIEVVDYIIFRIQMLLDLLEAYYKHVDDSMPTNWENVIAAINYAELARKLIIKERVRIKQPGKAVILKNIDLSENYVDLASEILLKFSEDYSVGVYKLIRIQSKYNLNTPIPKNHTDKKGKSSYNEKEWVEYAKNVSKEINDKYNIAQSDPSARKAAARVIKQELINNLLPLIPKPIKYLIIQEQMNDIITPLLKAFPLDLSNDTNPINVITKTITKAATSLLNTAQIPRTRINEKYPFSHTFIKDTQNVKYYEVLILCIPSLYSMLDSMSSLFDTLLSKIEEKLTTVIDKMQTAVEEHKLTSAELVFKRNDWARELQSIKPSYGPIRGISVPGQSGFVSAVSAQDLIFKAGQAQVDLKNFIIDKTFDSLGFAKPDIALAANTFAQIALLPLLLNSAILISRRSTKKVMNDLYALKALLSELSKLDRLEIDLCNEYINIVEGHETFSSYDQYYAAGLAALAPYSDIYSYMKNGDLGAIITIGESVSETAKVAQTMYDCFNKDPKFDKKYNTVQDSLNWKETTNQYDSTNSDALLNSKNSLIQEQDLIIDNKRQLDKTIELANHSVLRLNEVITEDDLEAQVE